MYLKTKDLKKHTRIQLRNGWYATLLDNAKGTIRFAEVEGYVTEMGSIYSYDIDRALVNGEWVDIEYTEKEMILRKTVETLL